MVTASVMKEVRVILGKLARSIGFHSLTQEAFPRFFLSTELWMLNFCDLFAILFQILGPPTDIAFFVVCIY